MLKEIEKINNSNFNEFLNNRINLTYELQEKFNRKFGVSNEIKVISKDCKLMKKKELIVHESKKA